MKKILGFIFLFCGLAIIIYGLYSSYGIFTAKKDAPVIFEMPKQSAVQKGAADDLQAQLQGLLGDQLKGLMPADSIPQLLNLLSWSIFAGILTFAGGQIAGLGIKLLR